MRKIVRFEEGSNEKKVEIVGGCIAAEGVRCVWTQVEYRGEKPVLILYVGTSSDFLLGEEAKSDGG